MTGPVDLDGPRVEPRSGGPARELIILLHGLGADGDDLMALASMLGQVFPDAAFVSPHAPEPCDMAPGGYQWFSFQVRAPEAILERARAVAPTLNAFIDKELRRLDLPDDRLALIGFSQGTMMALHVALRRENRCAAVVGYSGALVGPEALPAEIKSRPPVLLVHGDADEVVPYEAMAAAVSALEANQVHVFSETREGLGHGIDETGIGLGAGLLMQVLYPSRLEEMESARPADA